MTSKASLAATRVFAAAGLFVLIALCGAVKLIQPAAAKSLLLPSTGTWTTKAPLPAVREHVMSGVINDLLYVVGGFNGTTLAELNTHEVYDPTTNSWSARALLPTARHGGASAVINGKLYVAGGCNAAGAQSLNVLEVYDPATNTWTMKASLPTSRCVPGFAAIGGKLYVVGGVNIVNNTFLRTNVLEVYDPITDTWATKVPMPTARAYPTAEAIDGKLYVIGGDNNNVIYGTLEVYDPATNTWATKTPMPTPRTSLVSGVIGGRLYAVGGVPTQSGASETVINESYDPATNIWRAEDPLPTARWGAAAEVINDTLYVVGGATGRGQGIPLAANEAFSPRLVRVLSNSAAPGSNVVLPVELVSLGDENALGFSLTFDTNILSNPQAALGTDAVGATLNLNLSQTAQGRVGLAVALPATQRFAAGTRQLVNVTFTIAANAPAVTTPVGFADQPISREVADAAAVILPTSYTPGSVTVSPGYEADVTPRPNGNNNGTVTIADWVQAGRFAAGVDTAAAGNEFQRADCAPKETKGDGKLSIADWVQAGRYAAGLDAVVSAGGPTAPVSGLLAEKEGPNNAPQTAEQQAARTIRLRNASLTPGQTGALAIEFDALGNENALGFSLNFDPAKLRFVTATVANEANGAQLNVNANQAANGRVGLAVALPAGQSFAAGTRQLLVVTLVAAANAAGAVTLTLGDAPIGREVVDATARGLTANWVAGVVTVARSVASVSAASFSASAVASETMVAAFGVGLATNMQAANSLPLPTTLAGTTVRVRDGAGVERLAPLFFVAPGQVNYLVPLGTAAGEAEVTVTSGDGAVSIGKVRIAPVAPGLFAANANGQGVAAAVALRVRADGTPSFEPIARFDAALNRFVAVPLDLGAESEQVFLLLYGTGWRARSSLSGVTVKLGGVDLPVSFAGAQGDLAGLDQINARLPRTLAGRGELDLVLNVDGVAANVVRVSVK